jgi:hypothetical protein
VGTGCLPFILGLVSENHIPRINTPVIMANGINFFIARNLGRIIYYLKAKKYVVTIIGKLGC